MKPNKYTKFFCNMEQ